MAYYKAISGHTGTGGIRRYLEKGGRALAVDLLNLGSPEMCADWAARMDETRRLAHNDVAYRGRRCRTFKHYVLSPDPGDEVSLDQLREVAVAWAQENYPDFEVAIVYHDDNASHVPHAHVVVNNTDLSSGGRLREPDPGALNGSFQSICRDLGLTFFTGRIDDGPRVESEARVRAPGRAEREIAARDGVSWVASIRARVAIARDTSETEREFVRALGELGVAVRATGGGAGEDWVFADHALTDCQVSGTRLGASFTRQGVRERLGAVPRGFALDARKAAAAAAEIGGVSELERISRTVDLISRRGFSSIAGIDAAVSKARDTGSAALPLLLEARDCCREKGLLPEHMPKRAADRRSKEHPTKKRSGHVQGAKTNSGGSIRSDRPLDGRNRDERSRR